jgi:hypothetical protein
VKCAILYDKGWYVGDVRDAPSRGVLGIVFPDPVNDINGVGTIEIRGWDYYILKDDEWYGINGIVDFVDHVLDVNPERILKGRMVSRTRWREATKEISGFPEKSASIRGFEEENLSVPDGVSCGRS